MFSGCLRLIFLGAIILIMKTLYTSLKVNNEYEICEVYDPDCKALLEKSFLANRISYFIKWPKVSIFSRRKFICIFCVNENAIYDAEDIIAQIVEDTGYEIKFLDKKSTAGDNLF